MQLKGKNVQLSKEMILYGLFGVITTIVNLLSFHILIHLGIVYTIANLVAIVLSKIVAYVCNKIFVFKSHSDNIWSLLKEVLRFIIARGLTGVIDYFGVIVLVKFFKMSEMSSKIILTVIVIILNYIFSKKMVFKHFDYKRDNNNEGTEYCEK